MFVSEDLTVNEKNHLVIGKNDTVELAKEFGTPLYVLDEDLIRKNCRVYKNAMDKYYGGNGLVLYANKAFCSLFTCRLVKEEGLGIDVVSGGELYTAIKADFPMDKVYFHGNNKTADEIELAVKNKVGNIIVDNIYELEALNETAKKYGVVQNIMFRIKPGVDAHTHSFIQTGQIDSKFGVALENGEAFEIIEKASKMSNVKVNGVHCHIGSQIFDIEPFCKAAEIMMNFVGDLKDKLGLEIDNLNLGGGYGIMYTENDDPVPYDEYIQHVSEVVKATAEKGLSLEAEVGSIGGEEDGVIGKGEVADPKECKSIADLGVDFLAAGIGNIHGKYPANWEGLDFDALDAIQAETGKLPLVLHGGSGIPDEMIKKAITLGVSKVNVNTECQLYFQEATRKYIEAGKDLEGKGYDPRKLLAPGAEAIKQCVKDRMEVFGCIGKA